MEGLGQGRGVGPVGLARFGSGTVTCARAPPRSLSPPVDVCDRLTRILTAGTRAVSRPSRVLTAGYLAGVACRARRGGAVEESPRSPAVSDAGGAGGSGVAEAGGRGAHHQGGRAGDEKGQTNRNEASRTPRE
jgi:hypothetical protein